MEQAPAPAAAQGPSPKYKVDDVVTVTPIAGAPVTGTVTFVQAVKDTTRSGQWTYRYTVRTDTGALAAPERLVSAAQVSAAQVNGGKRKGKTRRRRGRRTRKSFSR